MRKQTILKASWSVNTKKKNNEKKHEITAKFKENFYICETKTNRFVVFNIRIKTI
jgi:hypothetical protein